MFSLTDPTNAAKWRTAIPRESPTPAEVVAAIQQLHVGRVSGSDGLTAELLKFGCDAIAPVLVRLFHAIWHYGHVPPDWALSEILPILKRGKPDNELSSYRPISIVSMVSKVQARLGPIIDDTVGDYQHGFRSWPQHK